MTIKLANNVTGFLNTAITASDTGIVLQSGNGASFPALGAGEYFYATLVSTGGTLEVVKVTARSGDSMTVVRAQDGSSAASFAAGSRLEMRINAQAVRDAIGDVVASQVGFTPTGSVSATDVQAALAELADPSTVNATGTGTQTVFPVVVKPSAIYVSGVYQNKSTWSYAGGNVTFTQAPPVTSTIEFLI